MAGKLTTAQWKLLSLIGNDLIRRDDSSLGRPLYQPYRTDTFRAVNSRTLDKLLDLGLAKVALDAAERRQIPIVLTDAGRESLKAGAVIPGS